MKLERINDNQIRITLDPRDFDDFDVSVVDLLTDREGKAKEFLETLMHMAKDDLNFEVDGGPIMVEVTQTGQDAIVLMVTKVDGDQKPEQNRHAVKAPFGQELKDKEEKEEQSIPSIPLQPTDNDKKVTPSYGVCRFKTLDDVILVAKMAEHYYDSDNSLYKDSTDENYYLMYTRSRNTEDEFKLLSNHVREFGEPATFHYASRYYLEEHFTLVIANEALQLLAET